MEWQSFGSALFCLSQGLGDKSSQVAHAGLRASHRFLHTSFSSLDYQASLFGVPTSYTDCDGHNKNESH